MYFKRIKLKLKSVETTNIWSKTTKKWRKETHTHNFAKILIYYWLIQKIWFWSHYMKCKSSPLIYPKNISKLKTIFISFTSFSFDKIKNTISFWVLHLNFVIPSKERKLSKWRLIFIEKLSVSQNKLKIL